MSHRKPSALGTLFLVLLLAALLIPAAIVVAHDSLPQRWPWTEHRQGRD